MEKDILCFLENVELQQRYIEIGNSKNGNIAAKKFIAAAKNLMKDEAGYKAFHALLKHESDYVKEMAASFLLKKYNEESLIVLRNISKRNDLLGFSAQEAIKRWNEGNWHLDD